MNTATVQNARVKAIASLTAYFKVDESETFMWLRKFSRLGLPLLNAAIDRAIDLFPPGRLSPAEFLIVVKDCRAELLKANPHQPCEACEYTPGFVEVMDAAGVKRMKRCDCWGRWTNQLEELVGELPASPAPRIGQLAGGASSSVASIASDLGSASTPQELSSKLRRFEARVSGAQR